jgi:hypothetical protein
MDILRGQQDSKMKNVTSGLMGKKCVIENGSMLSSRKEVKYGTQ